MLFTSGPPTSTDLVGHDRARLSQVPHWSHRSREADFIMMRDSVTDRSLPLTSPGTPGQGTVRDMKAMACPLVRLAPAPDRRTPVRRANSAVQGFIRPVSAQLPEPLLRTMTGTGNRIAPHAGYQVRPVSRSSNQISLLDLVSSAAHQARSRADGRGSSSKLRCPQLKRCREVAALPGHGSCGPLPEAPS